MKFKREDSIRLKAAPDRVGEVLWQSGKLVRVRWPDGTEESFYEKDVEAVPVIEGESAFVAYDLCAERGVMGPYDAEVLVGRLHKLVWRTLTGDITHVELVHLDGSYVATVATSRRGGVPPQQIGLCLDLLLEVLVPAAHERSQHTEDTDTDPAQREES